MRFKEFAITLCLCIFSNNAAAGQNIDVLIGAAPEALGMQNAFDAATDLALKMPLIMANNGTPTNVYRFGAYPLAVDFQDEGTATSADAVNYLYGLTSISPFIVGRESTPIPVLPGLPPPAVTGFDIIVMLVSEIEPQSGNPDHYACGATYTNTNLLNAQGQVQFGALDRYNYFAIVLSLEPRCRQDLTLEAAFMHEMGHIMGGRHQTTASPQVPYARPYAYQPNPDPRNHKRTAMWSPWEAGIQKEVYSSPTKTFPGTTIIRGSSNADMSRFVNERWNHVSTYLPIPEPEECDMEAHFQFCLGDNSSYAFTATLPGYEVTSADYDISFWGGPWSDVYEGALICPSASGIGEAVARAILQTASGQSECEVFISFSNCGDQNPW